MTNEVSLNLKNYINNLLPEQINKGLELCCQSIENEAKENCPVDDGTLRAMITHSIDDGIGTVGTNCEYAPYVHEGTGIYAKDGMGRKEVPWKYKGADGVWHTTKGIKPNPFLQKAVDKLQGDLLNIFVRGVNR